MKNLNHGRNRPALGWALAMSLACIPLQTAEANGLGEGRPWQFDTSADKSAKAAELDLMERKKGGYYDGFTNIYNSTTNIGTQINCSNDASATGNIAQNGQTGNAPSGVATNNTDSEAIGSDSQQDTSEGEGSSSNEQSNSGSVDSSVQNSPSNSTTGISGLAGSDQDLTNNQDNSGTQIAGVDSSTACAMTGANLSGEVSVPTGPLN